MAKKSREKKMTQEEVIQQSGFELYKTSIKGGSRKGSYRKESTITIGKSGNCFFSKHALNEHGIIDYKYALLYFNKNTNQIGFELLNDKKDNTRSISSYKNGSGSVFVTTKSFVRDMNIACKQSRLPLTRCETTGLLVATVTPAETAEEVTQ